MKLFVAFFALCLLLGCSANSEPTAALKQFGPLQTFEKDTQENRGLLSQTHTIVGGWTFEKNDNHIPALKGREFGLEYVVSLPMGMESAVFREEVVYPAGGLKNPHSGETKMVDFQTTRLMDGEVGFVSYALTEDWEVVPGVWTLRVKYEGAILIEQAFIVE